MRAALPILFIVLIVGCPLRNTRGQLYRASLESSVSEIEFGVAFSVEVRRSWPIDGLPLEWEDDMLAPLVVRQLSVDTRRLGERVLETRRFRCRPLRRGRLKLEARDVLPRNAALDFDHEADGARLILTVGTSLAGAPGEVELPERPPVSGDDDSISIMFLIAAGLFLGSFLSYRRGRRRALAPPEAPRARARRLLGAVSGESADADLDLVSAALRAAASTGIPRDPAVMTAREIEASISCEEAGEIGELLVRCDTVRYRGSPAAEEEVEEIIALARARLVEADAGVPDA